MSGPERLAEITAALDELGVKHLVMGGHAVRYYGVDRNTIDYDLHISVTNWDQLHEDLARSPLFAATGLVEGPSWRQRVFRRFQIGRLPDGREEWLEFWRANHLLAPFSELATRSEMGAYGGRRVRFLGLTDLMRSKETERASDIALLEEIRDARNLAEAARSGDYASALGEVRSRKGFESLLGKHVPDAKTAKAVAATVTDAITAAFLTPYLTEIQSATRFEGVIGEIIAGPLRSTTPASARHLALVEAVRRLYKQNAMAADRADKQVARSSG